MASSAEPKPAFFQRAFTLIEMLVVMVIIGLLVTVIMQGFGYSLGMYQRVVKLQHNAYTDVLVYSWLRSTLGASVAARPKNKGLEGNTVEVVTETYQPLVAVQGLRTKVVWMLVQGSESLRLEYREGNTTFNVHSWPQATGRWEYMDDKKGWHNKWPLSANELPSLPNAIRLQVFKQQEEFNYVVIVSGRKTAEVTAEEAMHVQ